MAYRELFVVETREVLRLWQKGFGYRRSAALAGVDRRIGTTSCTLGAEPSERGARLRVLRW
jgi:hypothetical protein